MQISSIQNRNNNQNFKGNLSRPVAGALSDFVESHSNVNSAIGMIADAVEFETKSSLNIALRELPKAKENALNNVNIMFNDASTGTIGAKEFFLDKAKSAQDIYFALEKALREVVPESFIR